MKTDLNKALTTEAIRLLDIPDTPDLYHRLRRFARVHIKHEAVAPIDMMNWPKGCLMCGLMHLAVSLQNADNSKDRAISILAMASVQNRVDTWIGKEAPLYFVDDVLAAQALLALAGVYEASAPDLYMRYMKVADGVMRFLYGHDTDAEGVLPYRPAHGTGQIFADSMGMVVPFAIRYGLMKEDDDALDWGVKQITIAIKHFTEPDTGLPWHVYSLDTDPDSNGGLAVSGALGWGRGLGWIMYALGASAEAFAIYPPKSALAVQARKKMTGLLNEMAQVCEKYRRVDGLFGSIIGDPDSPADTSASAMILYAMLQAKKHSEDTADGSTADGTSLKEDPVSCLLPYISSSGRVGQAQGECMGIGLYSDTYDSYPWSVGMTMMLI